MNRADCGLLALALLLVLAFSSRARLQPGRKTSSLFVDDPAILRCARRARATAFGGLFGDFGRRRPRHAQREIAGLQDDRRHDRRRRRRAARRDEGRRAAALRSHRRQCRPRHRHALADDRGRALQAGRRRQPARPPRFSRSRGEAGCGEVRLHLPARLRLQEEGQAAVVAPAGRFQRGLFDVAAGRRRRLHGRRRPLAAAARRGGRCRLAGRRAARSVRS